MQKVAIVILNWNGENFLKKFLPSVINYSSFDGVNVIVADNGSNDGSIELLKNSFPTVGIIELGRNWGFAEGYNRALKQIESEYYVLLNSDVEVSEGWLQPLIQLMDNTPLAAACMPKILDYNNPTHFEYAGAAGGFIDFLGYPFCRGRILSSIEEDKGQYDNALEIFWASGACLFVRSKLFWNVGGLDNDFFAHMEEIDLSWRLKNIGYSNWCIPSSKVYHVGGGTLPNNNPRKLYYNYRNSLYMLYKNLPANRLIVTLGIRLILDGLSAIAYLVNGKYGFFKAVLNAHIDYWRNFRSLINKRKTIQRKGKNKSGQILKKSILINFFILKRRTFNTYHLSYYSKLR
jgi:GT2 family glycosyltransferase